MERQVTNLLTMLNEAQEQNKKSLNFKSINISDDARQTILQLWNYQHMRVWQWEEDEEPYISVTCLRFNNTEYQVRNIPLQLFPIKGTLDNDYTEICINFDRQGKIVDFNITMETQQYQEIVKGAVDVQDEYNRKLLAHWMEQLATAYNRRDINFFENVFSEDALIITGVRKIERKATEVRIADQERYEYNIKTKREYLDKLKNQIFNVNINPSINIVFTDQKYRRHGGSPRYYIVDATQHWNTTSYSDVGHIFLIWDFKDPERPQILVRVWQHPDDTKQFSARDFNLPQ